MHQYRELTCTDAFLRFISEVQIAQENMTVRQFLGRFSEVFLLY